MIEKTAPLRRTLSLFVLCAQSALVVPILYHIWLCLSFPEKSSSHTEYHHVWEPLLPEQKQAQQPNSPVLEWINIIASKRGVAPPGIELAQEVQKDDEDYSDDTLKDLDIVLWTTEPSSWNLLKHHIIVTRRDPNFLHERLEHHNVRFRVCREDLATQNANITTNGQQHLPPCPMSMDSDKNNQSRGERFMNSHAMSKVEIWENVSSLVNFNGQELPDLLRYVSYWNDHHKRHVLLPSDEKVKISSCSDPNCPKLCTRDATSSAQEADPFRDYAKGFAGFHHAPIQWDQIDFLCKDRHYLTQPPYRNFGGACNCGGTCFTPAANQINSTWPWTSAEERNQFYPNGAAVRRRMDRACLAARNEQRPEARYACDAVQQIPSRNSSGIRGTSSAVVDGNRPPNNLTLTCPIQAAGTHHLMFIPESKLLFCVSLFVFGLPCM
jgi:hypothetical protein